MNMLKNILFFGLLIVVLCGVYFALKQQPESPLPKELASEVKPLTVSGVPGLSDPPGASISGGPNVGATNVLTGPPPPFAPSSTTPGGAAPSFPSPSGAGSVAPNFSAPTTANGVAPAFPSPSTTSNVAPPFASPPGLNGAPGVGGPSSTDTRVGSLPLPALPPPPTNSTPPGRNYPPGVRDPSLGAPPGSLDSLPKPPADPFGHKADAAMGPSSDERARTSNINGIIQQVDLKVRKNELAEALLLLSQLYDNPDVPEAKAREITEILDGLAAKVIFSRELFLGPAYGVQPGDTLDSIANQCNVPALLLARINGIGPQDIRPGKELKVVKGPFTAHVSLARSEMKLVLDGRYAVRFPVALSGQLQHETGLYHVEAKSAAGADGSAAKPQWIELSGASGKIGIEAAADPRSAAASKQVSTIYLSEQDMDDVYGILSVGSALVIQQR